MEYNKNTTCGVGYSVTTPSFPENERMTRFYTRAHEIIEGNFEKIRRERGGGMLTSDFSVTEENGIVTVTLRQRMRVCGRLAGEKVTVHLWRNGEIAKRARKKKQKHR